MFKITGEARTYLLKVIEAERQVPEEELFLRLSMGIGWGVPKLNLSLEEQKIKGDRTFDFDSLIIIINEKEYDYFNQFKLDYREVAQGKNRFQLIKI